MNNSLRFIETIAVYPRFIPLLEQHIFRIKKTALQVGIPDINDFISLILKDLEEFSLYIKTGRIYRLSWIYWNKEFIYSWDHRAFPTTNSTSLGIHKITYNLNDKFINLKTNHRENYSEALKLKPQFQDLLFINQDNIITESSIAAVFFRKSNLWFTPCLSTGCVDSTFKHAFAKKHNIIPCRLHYTHLNIMAEIYLGNAIRGLWKIKVIH